MSRVSESVVEDAALDWLRELGYEVLSGLTIAPGEPAAERSDYKQVFLFERLQTRLEDLNPQIPLEGLQEALLRKLRLINHPTLIENNRAFHRLLVEGVDVEFRNKSGEIVHDKVWLIDFANPEANEFLAVNQFTVEEGHFNRRPDVVVFINGIPVAVLELKNIADEQATIRKAFDQFQHSTKAQNPVAVSVERVVGDFRRPRSAARHGHIGLGAVHDVAHHHGQRIDSAGFLATGNDAQRCV